MATIYGEDSDSMPVGDKQRLIVEIVADVLGQAANDRQTFPWLVNRHTPESLGDYYSIVERLFRDLGGDMGGLASKSVRPLVPDAYFGGAHHFLFEFDEMQHFSTARLATLRAYPTELALGYDFAFYQRLCTLHSSKADKYRQAKRVPEFPHPGGRTRQRALFDCIRDLAAINHGLKPTVRISEFEVEGICENNGAARDRIKDLLQARGVR